MKKILFMLGELDEVDIEWLLYVGTKEKLPAGTKLIQEGFPVDALYVVLSGTLGVAIEALNNKPIAELSSGEIVGEISFLDARPPLATVTAIKDAARFYQAIALFMADRLRTTVALLGYGYEEFPDSPLELVRDLSPTVVEHLPRARQRLELLIKRLRGF
jgi:CRP/FNR family transcriptional regulator, cyclic AMP receptor protein